MMHLLRIFSLLLLLRLGGKDRVLFSSAHDHDQIRQLEEAADTTICTLSGGTINESSGKCEICLNAANCQCIMNTQTFDIDCSSFCIGYLCGAASCKSGVAGASCEGVITPNSTVGGGEEEQEDNDDDESIHLSFVCDATRVCTCSAEYRGQACSECDGAAEGIDCSNVPTDGDEPGPCFYAGSCMDATQTQPPTAAPATLPRPYRTDASFLQEVGIMTLHEASDLVGVPIGAAVPDNAGGRVWSLDVQKRWVPSVYNMIVVENGMKWNNLLKDPNKLDVYDFTNADAIVNHAVNVGAIVRGHVLIWGRGRGKTYPEEVALQVEMSADPKGTLTRIMDDHIRTVVSHFGGRVDVWDVINEHLTSMIDENIFYTTLGNDYIRFAFETASKYLAEDDDDSGTRTTRLIWNEALSNFKLDDPTIVWWLDTLRRYKEELVPIDGIGVQGHNINQRHNTSDLAIFLQKVVDMGYDVELTEVDAPISLFFDDDDSPDDDPFMAQGEFFQEYANACLRTGRCKGITFWGLDDNHTWYDTFFLEAKPNLPLLIDEEGYMKPAWLKVRDAFVSFSKEMETSGPTIAPTATPTTTGEESNDSWHRNGALYYLLADALSLILSLHMM